jgi:hypothetical protein
MGPESERRSRRTRIDPKLRASGWFVVSHRGVGLREYERAAVEEKLLCALLIIDLGYAVRFSSYRWFVFKYWCPG